MIRSAEKSHDQSCVTLDGIARSMKRSRFVYNDGKGGLVVQSSLITSDARDERVPESPLASVMKSNARSVELLG
jgi:hypothetical protein